MQRLPESEERMIDMHRAQPCRVENLFHLSIAGGYSDVGQRAPVDGESGPAP